MKAKPRRILLAATAVCGLLFVSVQPAAAFELLARRLGDGAAQKCDACQKGGDACQKGACQKGGCDKGACQKGACQKGGYDKGACQKGACQKGGCDKGACQKSSHQKSWGSHQKGAAQKGGKGKGSFGPVEEQVGGIPYFGAPVPAPIFTTRSA
ncbi:MAG: hypothetical protein ABI614_12715 [Planctomycetota bacterium]